MKRVVLWCCVFVMAACIEVRPPRAGVDGATNGPRDVAADTSDLGADTSDAADAGDVSDSGDSANDADDVSDGSDGGETSDGSDAADVASEVAIADVSDASDAVDVVDVVDVAADDGPSCSAPRAVCGGACVDTTSDVAHCGRCGNVCPTGQSCIAGACACPTGRTLCDGMCTDLTVDARNCGMCGNACPAVPNATPTCAVSTCGYTCNSGFARMGSSCNPVPAPRPIAPLSGSVVTSRRPTLEWQLPSGVTGANVELCRDRDCAMRIVSFPVTGSSGRPDADLPQRVVFWRLAGRVGSSVGLTYGPVWQFTVGARSATMGDAAWGTGLRDINGDGYDDIAVGAVDGPISVFYGSASGIGMMAIPTIIPSPVGSGQVFGAISQLCDVNGDGRSDLITSALGAFSGVGRVFVFCGAPSPDGIETVPSVILMPPMGARVGFGQGLTSADFDGDGFCDVAVGTGEGGVGQVYVFHGASTGLATSPLTTISTSSIAGLAANDVDGNGFVDLVATTLDASVNRGESRVYLGSSAGVGTAASGATIIGSQANERLIVRAGVGDVNRDGYGDIGFSTDDECCSRYGSVRVYPGAREGLAIVTLAIWSGGTSGAYLGSVSAGDYDANGYADILAGERNLNGLALMFQGGPSGLPATRATATATLPPRDNGAFGRSTAASDVNGDGYTDAIIVAPEFAPSGRVYIFLGSPTGIGRTPNTTLTGTTTAPLTYDVAP